MIFDRLKRFVPNGQSVFPVYEMGENQYDPNAETYWMPIPDSFVVELFGPMYG